GFQLSSPRAMRRSPPAGPTRLPPLERERALGLHAKDLTRTRQCVRRPQVLRARSRWGLAQSAVALAAAYDPDELATNVVSVAPDVGTKGGDAPPRVATRTRVFSDRTRRLPAPWRDGDPAPVDARPRVR